MSAQYQFNSKSCDVFIAAASFIIYCRKLSKANAMTAIQGLVSSVLLFLETWKTKMSCCNSHIYFVTFEDKENRRSSKM